VSKPKVYIYTPLDESRKSHEEIAAAGCEVALGDLTWRTTMGATHEDVLAPGLGAHAMIGGIVRGLTFDGAFMDRMPDLRIIAKYSIGYDDIDIDAAADRGILVTHSPTEANWGAVAEGTMAMSSALAPISRANNPRSVSTSSKYCCGPTVQGRRLRRRPAIPAVSTEFIMGDMAAHRRKATSSGRSNRCRWQGIIQSSVARPRNEDDNRSS